MVHGCGEHGIAVPVALVLDTLTALFKLRVRWLGHSESEIRNKTTTIKRQYDEVQTTDVTWHIVV